MWIMNMDKVDNMDYGYVYYGYGCGLWLDDEYRCSAVSPHSLVNTQPSYGLVTLEKYGNTRNLAHYACIIF